MDDHSFFMGSEIPALNSWSEVVSPSESATFAASQQPLISTQENTKFRPNHEAEASCHKLKVK